MIYVDGYCIRVVQSYVKKLFFVQVLHTSYNEKEQITVTTDNLNACMRHFIMVCAFDYLLCYLHKTKSNFV